MSSDETLHLVLVVCSTLDSELTKDTTSAPTLFVPYKNIESY